MSGIPSGGSNEVRRDLRTGTSRDGRSEAQPGGLGGGAGPDPYDVLIIGAGVVGAAVARELARYPLRVALVDAADDVGAGTSKANTAILHTGFDATPGTLESRLVRRGHELLRDYAARAGIPVERTGAILIAWTEGQRAALPGLAEKAAANGYDATELIGPEECYRREPHLGPGALGGLVVPDESVICPWTTPLAYATEAVRAGADLRLRTRVTGVTTGTYAHEVRTDRGVLHTRYLVNAAGLHADAIDRMLGHRTFTVTPRRGQLIVYDKLSRPLLTHILLPVPTAVTKGVLVAPTVYGNVLLGPTAEDLDDRTATGSTAEGLAGLRDNGAAILPELVGEEVTAVYAGLRAATEHADYQIAGHPDQRYVTVGGIRSTGLTASLAIAEHVRGLLAESGLSLGEPRGTEPPRMPNLGEAYPRPYQRADLIAGDPAYGEIVCHCERVTRGEIRDALRTTVPARTLAGLARRTRATNGRCQAFYCGAEVRALLEASGGRLGAGDMAAGPGRGDAAAGPGPAGSVAGGADRTEAWPR